MSAMPGEPVRHGQMVTTPGGERAWECFAGWHSGDAPKPVQVIPAGGPWHVVITSQTTEYGGGGTEVTGRCTGERQVFRVIGWALLGNGDVEPLFIEEHMANATWPREYRMMHHDCGMLDEPSGAAYSTVHHVTAVYGEPEAAS